MAITSKSFLDKAGLTAFWAKAKAYIDNGDKTNADAIEAIVEALGGEDGDISDLTPVEDQVNDIVNGLDFEYNSTDKKIYLKNDSTTIGSVDCSDFIKDSFLKGATVADGTGENDGKKVIKFTMLTVERPGEAGTETTFEVPVDGIVTAIDSRVSALETTVGNASSGLVKDVADLKAADTSLGNRITALENSKDDYKAADTALKTEIETAYKAADTALETAVNNGITAIPTTEVEALFA